MLRPITGYHQDDANDWVAELSCGHDQHVRHKPPFLSRPWVITPAGRASMLGTELDCVRCDRIEMPDGLVAYKRTPEFDEGTIPGGLRKNHATKPGVWGVIHVVSGRLRYRIDGLGGRELLLDPQTPGVVVPEVLHHVDPGGPVRFFVEFRRKAMEQPTRSTMRAIAIDRFGGPDTLALRTLPVPTLGPDEVLLRVEVAGVGEWDPFEREGGYAQMLGLTPAFPYVLGSEGAGTVVAVGEQVSRFREGDRVYALGFLNPKGGFYAEYAAVNADLVSLLPGTLTLEQAAVMGGVGITALRGLDDTLRLKQGESVMIFGASGGVGHTAVQLAKRMGARVLAVASGDDGVALVERLGADAAVDGRKGDVLAAARAFASGGLDAALLAAGGEAAQQALLALRDSGRAAYPNGVQPEPKASSAVQLSSYNGEPDAEIIGRLNRLVASRSFHVEIARRFPLAQAAEAHLALGHQHLGKLALLVN